MQPPAAGGVGVPPHANVPPTTGTATPPPAMSGKRLQAEYPNAHKILSELHLMKRLNEELFMQLEETRCALDGIADGMPSAATALGGVRHILDPDVGSSSSSIKPVGSANGGANAGLASPSPEKLAVTNRKSAPALPEDASTAGGGGDDAVERTKRRFLQFVDETIVKAKQHTSGSGAVPAARNFEEEYFCLRTKVLAHENAQHLVAMSKQRVEDAQSELRLCRGALRDTSSELEQVRRERDALRVALTAAQQAPRLPSTGREIGCEPAAPPAAAAAQSPTTAVPVQKRMDMFDSMFDDMAPKKAKGTSTAVAHGRTTSAGSAEDPQAMISQLVGVTVELEAQLKAAHEKVLEAVRANERLEATVSAAQLEAEALRTALREQQDLSAALRRDVAALESGRDALMEGVSGLQANTARLESQIAADRDTIKKLTVALAEQRTAADSATGMSNKLKTAQEELGRATASGMAEKQRREQAEREVFALQRMLNSVDLDREQSGTNNGVDNIGSRGASAVFDGTQPHAAGDARRATSLGTGSGGHNGGATRGGGGGGDEQQLEETVLRLRLALKDATRARKASETELGKTMRANSIYRRGLRSLGTQVAEGALLNEFHRWLLALDRTQPQIGGGAHAAAGPLVDVRPSRVAFGQHTATQTDPPHNVVVADETMESPVSEVAQSSGAAVDAATATAPDHFASSPAPPGAALGVDDNGGGHCCGTCKTLADRVRELLAEKKVQHNTVLELRDSLRTVLAAASAHTATSATQDRHEDVDDEDCEDEGYDADAPHRDARWVTASGKDERQTTHLVDGAAHRDPAGHSSRQPTPPAAPDNTTAARNSSSDPLASFPVQQRTASRVSKGGGASGAGGGGGRLVSGLLGRFMPTKRSIKTAADANDVVPRQQLQNVQRLLEQQLRENMDLHERLAAVNKDNR